MTHPSSAFNYRLVCALTKKMVNGFVLSRQGFDKAGSAFSISSVTVTGGDWLARVQGQCAVAVCYFHSKAYKSGVNPCESLRVLSAQLKRL